VSFYFLPKREEVLRIIRNQQEYSLSGKYFCGKQQIQRILPIGNLFHLIIKIRKQGQISGVGNQVHAYGFGHHRSKEFVSTNYQRFKHLFYSKHEKKPKPIKGLEGVYSLKRLSEVF